jgi:hypothetical protein
MIINCLHTYSSEDEHSFHVPYRNERQIARGDFFFYSGLDKRYESYRNNAEITDFDTYAILLSEYTQRTLSFQIDAFNAFVGVAEAIADMTGWPLLHGLPEADFDAALLWVPAGPSTRRRDPETGVPLFPSWSWLGWDGHVTYPWTLERDTFMTTLQSPLIWCSPPEPTLRVDGAPDAKTEEDWEDIVDGLGNVNLEEWFTSEDVCFPLTSYRPWILNDARKLSADHLSIRMAGILRKYHPDGPAEEEIQYGPEFKPPWRYGTSESHRLCFRTIVAELYVIGSPFKRRMPYNVRHDIHRLSIIDEYAHLVGYIDTPDPQSREIRLGLRRFAVLSRSTVDGEWEPEPDQFERRWASSTAQLETPPQVLSGMETRDDVINYKHATEPGDVHPTCNFDTKHFRKGLPWCMLNVMMLDTKRDSDSDLEMVDTRDAVGRIHIDTVRYWSCFSRISIVNLE